MFRKMTKIQKFHATSAPTTHAGAGVYADRESEWWRELLAVEVRTSRQPASLLCGELRRLRRGMAGGLGMHGTGRGRGPGGHLWLLHAMARRIWRALLCSSADYGPTVEKRCWMV